MLLVRDVDSILTLDANRRILVWFSVSVVRVEWACSA